MPADPMCDDDCPPNCECPFRNPASEHYRPGKLEQELADEPNDMEWFNQHRYPGRPR